MICLTVAVIAILMLTLPAAASAGQWQIASLGNASPRLLESPGGFTSLVFDRNGIAHISYYDPGESRVMYARLVNRAWISEVVAETGPVFSLSLSLYPDGTPAIAFRAGTPCGDLRYAKRRASTWTVETVDNECTSGSACPSSSLAVDSTGTPHIAYAGGLSPSGSLKYATKTGDGWNISAIDTENGTGFAASLVLDRSGLPAVAYIRKTGHCNTLMVAKAGSNGNWITTNVFTDRSESADNVPALSLTLDSRGNPHLGYYDNSRGEIIYVSFPDREPVSIERVTPVGRTRLSLALNAHDQPFISYYDPASRELRWATRGPDQSAWEIRTIEKMGEDAGEPVPEILPGSSLAFDPYGHPAVAYSSPATNGLKYAAWNAQNKFYLFR